MKKYKNEPRKADTSSLKSVMEEMFDQYRLKNKFDQKQVIHHWEKVMGKPIAKRTSKIFFKEDKMFVLLNSAPLKNELTMAKSRILQLLREEFGQDVVEDIVFL